MINMNLRGISMSKFYELTEKIALLMDDYLETEIEDLSNINDLIEKQIDVAFRDQRKFNEGDEINGGSN